MVRAATLPGPTGNDTASSSSSQKSAPETISSSSVKSALGQRPTHLPESRFTPMGFLRTWVCDTTSERPAGGYGLHGKKLSPSSLTPSFRMFHPSGVFNERSYSSRSRRTGRRSSPRTHRASRGYSRRRLGTITDIAIRRERRSDRRGKVPGKLAKPSTVSLRPNAWTCCLAMYRILRYDRRRRSVQAPA
mgnify:CR=1 FL=1